MNSLLSLIPKNHLSFIFGKLINIPLPKPLSTWAVKYFAALYGIDASEATRPIDDYRSIGEFFTRDLKPECRKIGSGLVSPVDGTLRSYGRIVQGALPQVKGRKYSVIELLGEEDRARSFINGFQYTLYLAPSDYHHIHAPLDGEIFATTYIPGHLWPVNDWSIENIDNLFSINERIICYMRTDSGTVAIVMVGATNVGKISLSYDSLVSNYSLARSKVKPSYREYKPPHPIKKGERLGTFNMGSTVLMLFEQEPGASILPLGAKVKFGKRIG